MAMRVNNRLVFKILCLVSAVLALVVLFLSCTYLPYIHYQVKCGKHTQHYITGLVAGWLAFIASFLQVVWAILLLQMWMEDVKKYFIGHLILGAVNFAVAVIIILHGLIIGGPMFLFRRRKACSLVAFLLINGTYCFASAFSLRKWRK